MPLVPDRPWHRCETYRGWPACRRPGPGPPAAREPGASRRYQRARPNCRIRSGYPRCFRRLEGHGRRSSPVGPCGSSEGRGDGLAASRGVAAPRDPGDARESDPSCSMRRPSSQARLLQPEAAGIEAGAQSPGERRNRVGGCLVILTFNVAIRDVGQGKGRLGWGRPVGVAVVPFRALLRGRQPRAAAGALRPSAGRELPRRVTSRVVAPAGWLVGSRGEDPPRRAAKTSSALP